MGVGVLEFSTKSIGVSSGMEGIGTGEFLITAELDNLDKTKS